MTNRLRWIKLALPLLALSCAGAFAADTNPPPSTQNTVEDVVLGKSVTFQVVADGTAPISFQWEKQVASTDGTAPTFAPIEGQTGDKFIIPKMSPDSVGVYRVKASNPYGFAYSPTVTIRAVMVPVIRSFTVTIGEPTP